MALTWEQHQQNIFSGESGGDYDALFGYQNRPNGAFAGIKVSEMPVGDVIRFTSPTGKYGQYVKEQVGRVATPVGAYQVVGTTLRDAVNALGIDPEQKFDKATQDKIGQYILKTQGTGAWEGYGKGGASMADQPTQPQQPQGLLGGILGGQGIGGALGLSDDFRDRLRMGILAGSDPRAFATQIAGAQKRIESRAEERKQQKNINKTIDYFQKKADAGDDLAASLLGAMQTNAIDPASAINTYISESTAVAKDNRSTSEKDYDRAVAGGYTGSFMDFLQAKKKDFNVDINTAGADDFSKALMKEMAKRYETYQTEADAAERTMSNLSLMDSIAQQDDFYSGFGADTLLRVRRAAVAFGADPDLVSDAETFNKIAKDSALQVMGGSLGVGFSNADREFVEAMVPNISNTVEGNRKIIAVQKKLQQRKIQLARLSEQYVDDNGTLKGFRGFIMDWSEKNPLFSPQDKSSLDPSAAAKGLGLSDTAASFLKKDE
jgi:hypothetical protein